MSYVGNQKFNWLLLITLLFAIEPFELEAQTKETLQRKISSEDSVSWKKKHAYQKRRSHKKIKTRNTRKKTAQLFRPHAGNLGSRDEWARKKLRADWSIMLGGLGALRPKYKGSDQYDLSGFPFIDIKYKRIFFLNFREGIGINILHAPNFRTGIAFNFYGGRDEDDSDSLKGLHDIDAGFNAGAFGSISFGKFSAKIKFQQDISNNHNGFSFTGRLGYRASLFKKLIMSSNLRATFASDNYMETYFGVTDAQSSSSGLRKFKAESGMKDVSAGANFIYPIDRHWSMITFLSFSRLLNDAANSPLVKDLGSKNQFWLGLGAAYRF